MAINSSHPTTPTRLLLSALPLATTLGAICIFVRMLGIDREGPLTVLLVILFAVLFLWIAVSFWTATLGFAKCLWRPVRPSAGIVPPTKARAAGKDLPRTVILMPVYNEDPGRVFAGLRASLESLRETGCGNRFDLFVLSDTTDPETWLEEELAWASLRESLDGQERVFYRHRSRNTGRKSGNIADFCKRWGSNYKYLVIFDADSVMAGATLVEMVWRMEEDPELGILQAPVVPVNRKSLFARCQQFAANVYGEVFTTGFALWTGTDGNYWGHNAIIRMAPFLEHCGLPSLPGRPPLGGEILSHDFVEAALMRRAGWKVVVAHDLGGSYEECPTTLTDCAKRDQRWCQGNMQHLRLVFTYGFHPLSRVHLAMGVMSYLSSPLWLLFMILGVVVGIRSEQMRAETLAAHGPALAWYSGRMHLALILLALTMALLLAPKLYGYLLLLRDPVKLRAQGGAARAGLSVLLEAVISILTAPLFMAFHTNFVISTLFGHTVQWNAQRRSEASTAWREVVDIHAIHTLLGLVAALAIGRFAPGLFWWMLPVLTGLVLSIPLEVLLSSTAVGIWLLARGILLIPEATETPAVLRQQQVYLAAHRAAKRNPRIHMLHQVVVVPAFNALHLAVLAASGAHTTAIPAGQLERIRQIALHGGPMYLTREHKLILLSDKPSLRWLHEAAWSHWPLEVLKAVSDAGLTRR